MVDFVVKFADLAVTTVTFIDFVMIYDTLPLRAYTAKG